MIKKPLTRRISSAILVMLGGTLMALTPETWPGALLLAFGIVLELLGIALEHKAK